jgi:hypothetical protein
MLDLAFLVTVCILIDVHSFYNAFQLWGRCMVRKHRHACGVAAELLAALEFPVGRTPESMLARMEKEGGRPAARQITRDWL